MRVRGFGPEVEGRTSGAWTAGRRPVSSELDSFDRVLGPLEKEGATLSADNNETRFTKCETCDPIQRRSGPATAGAYALTMLSG